MRSPSAGRAQACVLARSSEARDGEGTKPFVRTRAKKLLRLYMWLGSHHFWLADLTAPRLAGIVELELNPHPGEAGVHAACLRVSWRAGVDRPAP